MYARAYIYIIKDGESWVFGGSGEEDKADCIGVMTEGWAIGTPHGSSLRARKRGIMGAEDRCYSREALLLGRWEGLRKKVMFHVKL